MKIYYLAHPYSGDEEDNVKKSIIYTNKLLDAGFIIFNPLTHSHPLDVQQKRDPNFWYEFDLKFMNKFDGLILCPGWESSKGCKREFQRAKDLIIRGILYEIYNYEELIK